MAEDQINHEKAQSSPTVRVNSAPTSSNGDFTAPGFTPMYHQETHVSLDLDDYFKGPRNPYKHSKWPYFLRMHGSVLPKMIVPLTFLGLWASLITCITQYVYPLGVNTVLLTVTGFVVSLSLSFRSTTAYERYMEGRKYWAQLHMTSRNLARLIWVHFQERHVESAELGKKDLLGKLAALNLINAFAVALKHHLRFEPSAEYPDLAPLISNIHTFAADANQETLRERKPHPLKTLGSYLGMPFAESNPRKLVKRSKDNLGNLPMEILTYLSAYIETAFQEKSVSLPAHQAQLMTYLAALAEVLTGVERVVNTPLPIAYSISISQITWVYVLALPFQLAKTLDWVAIPGTMIAGYIILGLAQIGRELENPFGQDVNDLPLDEFCRAIAADIDIMTSQPAPLKTDDWMTEGAAKVLWPLSNMEYKVWETKSTEEIRAALKAKAQSRDVKQERKDAMQVSEGLTNESTS
ncbi:membrane protein [Teratosphaeria nubilosa]|uniref:Membrane protein n=1 Tax=Teratosphaeria nubilosa TaxID=161662 RepID=A0A6G1L2J4_9PEZI|nr:membrane protein [Teratosphaeria nubilosa]